MKRWKKTIIQLVAVVVLLIVGVLIARMLVLMKKPPAKKELQVIAPLVNAKRVDVQNMPMVVKGFGTVEPRTQVQIVPQVSGQVVECSPNLINGGFIEEGELVLRIDQRDYRLAVEAAQADVARAQVALDTEEAEAAVALREWQQLNPGTEPTSPLVLRQPQIRQAKATLEAARANLNKAKLALERTEIRLPFNARVSQESVDIGQFVSPGQMLATVYGTDVAEIVVPLEDRELEWFDVPILKTNGNGKPAGKGSPVLVHADFAGQVHTWNGRIVRTEGRIDAASRVVNVVVEVTEPFETTDSRPPLVPGMFVEVEIQGRQMDNIIQVPRYAVHNGDEIWVVNDEKLHIRKVKIARKDKEYSYISEGLEAGEVFITSPMDTVTDGMAVRAQLPETAQTQQGEDRE